VVLWPGVWAEDGIIVAVSIALDAPARKCKINSLVF